MKKKQKVLRIAWFGEKIDQKNNLKFFYPSPPKINFFEKKEKCLEYPVLSETIWLSVPPPPTYKLLPHIVRELAISYLIHYKLDLNPVKCKVGQLQSN